MVYLLESAYIVDRKTKETKICMKIGYASNVDDRFKAYGTANNPTAYRLSEREGSLAVESLFHYYYKDRMLPLDAGREWMEYDERIIEEFNTISIKELLHHRFSEDSAKYRFLNIILDHFYSDQTEDIFLGLYKAVSSEYLFMRDYYRGAYFSRYDFSALYNTLKSILSPIPESTEDNFIEELIRVIPEFLVDLEITPLPNDTEERISQDPELLKNYRECKELCSSMSQFEIIMKSACQILLNPEWKSLINLSDFSWMPPKYRNYLNYLGPEKLRAWSYYEASARRSIEDILGLSLDSSKELIINSFDLGKRYSLRGIKECLKTIYSELGLSKTPKATDILEYFEVKEVLVTDPITKKRIGGYEIISIK